MADDCVVIKKNMGPTRCNKFPKMIKGMFTVPDDFEATATEAVDVAFWQGKLLEPLDSRVFFWPIFYECTADPEATVYVTTPLGERHVRDGFYRWMAYLSENLCIHRAMRSHQATSGKLIFLDAGNNLIGSGFSDGVLRGLSIDHLTPEKMIFNTGADVSKSPIKIALKDNLEFDEEGVMYGAPFQSQLKRIVDVTLEQISAITTKIVVSVTVSCDGTEVLGLVKEDFDLDGQTITTITDNGDGTYDLNGTGLVDGTLNLVAPDVLSVQAYESEGAIDIDVT